MRDLLAFWPGSHLQDSTGDILEALVMTRLNSSNTLLQGMDTVEYKADDQASRKRELETLIQAGGTLQLRRSLYIFIYVSSWRRKLSNQPSLEKPEPTEPGALVQETRDTNAYNMFSLPTKKSRPRCTAHCGEGWRVLRRRPGNSVRPRGNLSGGPRPPCHFSGSR